ncbi:MFS transporter [Sporosarcina ureilytica]|uniref:MFS transporter n=1 Tax=Sporosarcina ureilytica TaxID=298596 RepID=A0A1D8JDP2_9BACL|nr:MFS transporter [Sporosarcina ureilytica]AOV06832.1 MFS transporter [Sporosarcina ureilytica]
MEIVKTFSKRRFSILVIIVAISGFSQGMLLPLISVIFERDGVSSAMNGLNATGLYIGTLLVSPFMEAPLRRFGYKPIIVIGGLIVFISLWLFPLWKSIVFWYILRLLIGIGDHALHFASQTWVTSFSSTYRLGRNIAIYGLSFGFGFAAGPLFVPLINVFEGLPFIVSGVLCMLAWSLVFFLKNDFPDVIKGKQEKGGTFQRFTMTIAVAWLAFLGPFGYGFLESSLNAVYPVYALRSGFAETSVSFLLASFSVGGLVSQLPLGMLSDRIGRRAVFLLTLGGGATAFLVASFLESSLIGVLGMFFVAGLFVGSIFSLGISYMSDLAPKELLPTGNLLCGIFFSLGSLLGPTLGGLFLELEASFSFLLLVSLFLATLFLISIVVKPKTKEKAFN